MRLPLRHTAAPILAAVVLTVAACAGPEPAPDAEQPTENQTAAPEAPAQEPADTPGPAEAPTEDPAGDSRGLVDRTGTWTEYDEETITFGAWDESQSAELDAYAAADAALDFLYLASEHETAFHTMPAYEARQYKSDDSEQTQQLIDQWWLGDTGADSLELGRSATPHVSPLSLIHSLGGGAPYDVAAGFEARGHDLRIENVSGLAFQDTETDIFATFAGDRALTGPVVMVDATVSGTINGTDSEGTPRSIDAPFSTVSVVMTHDTADNTWKVLDFVTYSQADFVGEETGNEFGD